METTAFKPFLFGNDDGKMTPVPAGCPRVNSVFAVLFINCSHGNQMESDHLFLIRIKISGDSVFFS